MGRASVRMTSFLGTGMIQTVHGAHDQVDCGQSYHV